MLNVVLLSVAVLRVSMPRVVMVCVVILHVILLNVAVLSVVLQSVSMISVSMLSVVMLSNVTRKLNKILPNFWKKVAQNTQRLIWKPKTTTLNYFWNLWTSPWVETACLGENWSSKNLPKLQNFEQSGHTDAKCH